MPAENADNLNPGQHDDSTRTQAVVASPVMAQVNDEPIEAPVDDDRAAIYARHDSRRREQLGVAEPAPTETPPADEEIVVKVNGKERSVPKSKIDAAGGIEAFQKNAAASELLNQASAERRRVQEEAAQLEARRRDLEEREQRIKQSQATPGTAEPGLPAQPGDQKALARAYHEAMLDGDLDRADELLLQINAAQKATAVNAEEIANRAVQRAREELTAEDRRKKAEEFEADRAAAVDQFETKHKDLTSPVARDLVDATTLDVYREHPDWTATAIIDEAANRVRELIKSAAPTPTPADPRLDAKRKATLIRGGSARNTTPPAPRPESRSEYVQKVREQRGLA